MMTHGQRQEAQKRWERMLHDSDPKLQVEALTDIARSYFLPEVTLRDVKFGATHTAGLIRPELSTQLRDAVLEKLQADEPRIRAEASLALVHWRDDKTISALQQCLKDSDSIVRLVTVQALATMEDPRLVATLVEVAETDSDKSVRAHALAALNRVFHAKQEEEGEPPLTAARRTAGPVREREAAAQDPILARLRRIEESDPSPHVRFLAQQACKRLRNQE